ncbi:hypothetical protein ACP4OV_009919 [Aristida adscensionis]
MGILVQGLGWPEKGRAQRTTESCGGGRRSSRLRCSTRTGISLATRGHMCPCHNTSYWKETTWLKKFLKLALPVELLWNVSMLLYDAVKVFTFLEPLPAQRDVLPILVIIDWVLMCVMLGAGSSSMAVVVFLQFDTRACSGGSSSGLHPRACSPRRGAAAGLTLWAWFFSLAVAVLMLWMQASRAAGQQ